MDTRIHKWIDDLVESLNHHYGKNEVSVIYESVGKDWDTTKAEIWMTNHPTRIPNFVLCFFSGPFNAANLIYDIVTKDNRVFIEICF